MTRAAGVTLIASLLLARLVTAGDRPPAPGASGTLDRFLEQYSATYRFGLGQPRGIQVTPSGDAVLFMRSPARSFTQDLWSYDVAGGGERVLLTAQDVLRGAEEHLTVEERARRERTRTASRGIAEFRLSEDGRAILVPLSGRLFVVERESGKVTELEGDPGAPIDPQWSPDGRHIALVRNGDLRVVDVAARRERRLTTGACDTVSHGLAEFVAQEEMGRQTGYWWSPDGARIAYQTARTGSVEVFHLQDPSHPERAPHSFPYPRPGGRNAEVELGIIDVSGGPTTPVVWNRTRYPYLASACWWKGAPLTILVQNRRQTEEALLAVDEKSGATRALLTERDVAWLNLAKNSPRWIDDGKAFVWMTERRGTWQLELRGRNGALLRALTPPSFNLVDLIAVDERSRVAWVRGGQDPTQLRLFRVRLGPRDAPGGAAGAMPEPVGTEVGEHDAVFARSFRVRVESFSGPDAAPEQWVVDAGGRRLGTLRSLAEEPVIRLHQTFETVGARGYRATVFRPADFRTGERYPVILSVYAGPHSNQVTRVRNRGLLNQWFADHGFVVVSLDGRGTPRRGRAWERSIRGDLSAIPLADQVDGLRALASRHPEMDLGRVGVYGWSFGGYFSAMATLRRPDVFRAGVAGAPVVDWHDYDTYYTERYMDLPENNRRGYDAASVLSYADRLERPLMIVHGTVDDNVYFLNSMKLVDALFRAGKPFEFVPLTGLTHMVPDATVTTRLYQRIVDFFARSLGAGTATDASGRTVP